MIAERGEPHPLRCRFDCFNDASKPMCNNWEPFYQSCKLLKYKQSICGKKEVLHPMLNSEKLWIIEQVGCASHSSAPSAEKVLERVLDIIKRADVLYETNIDLEYMKELHRQQQTKERGQG
jgi:hypothetical protein